MKKNFPCAQSKLEIVMIIVVTFIGVIQIWLTSLQLENRAEIQSVGNEVEGIGRGVESVKQDLRRQQLSINGLLNGDNVEPNEIIRGSTPFRDLKHFVVITAAETGGKFVAAPAQVDDGSGWTASVPFGDGGTVKGERFVVQVLATKSQVEIAPLDPQNVPGDAIFSEPIIVTLSK